LGFGVSNQLRYERLEWPEHCRRIMRSDFHRRLVSCLARHGPSSADFDDLDRFLALGDHRKETATLLRNECVFWCSVFDQSDQLYNLYMVGSRPSDGLNERETWTRLVASPLGLSIRLRTQSAYIRATRRLIEASPVDPVAGSQIFNEYRSSAPLIWTLDDRHGLANGSLTANINGHQRSWQQILTRLALRLRRHYDLHGRFPESLDEVCDESMPRIPLEWFLDKPIVYKPSGDAFLLDVPEAAEHRKGVRLKAHDAVVSHSGIEFKLRERKSKGVAK
jgi:hypothetical protein